MRDYGVPKEAVKAVEHILKLFDVGQIDSAEAAVAKLALDVCDRVEQGTLGIREADSYFTLIDLHVSDHHPGVVLSQTLRDILFEGMILHDYGKDFGANLQVMRQRSKEILERG